MAGPRMFDHEEALRLALRGHSYQAIAVHFGVTHNAVYQAVKRQIDPDWLERHREQHRLYQREKLKSDNCSSCGKVIWRDRTKDKIRTGKCANCAQLRSVDPRRPGELLCTTCERWKPDAEFARASNRPARRGRHGVCRSCQTEVKRIWRESVRVACVDCGSLCSPPGTNGRRTPADAPARCQRCANRHARETANA